jgi:hypothetical protein
MSQLTEKPGGGSQLLLYRTEGAHTRIEVRLQDDSVWLTQAQMADLFQSTPQEATCKDYLQVRAEGARSVQRSLKLYSLDAILAVGYRVRSPCGTQCGEDEAGQKMGGQEIHRPANTITARPSPWLLKPESQAMTP